MKYRKNVNGILGIFEDYPNAELLLDELNKEEEDYFYLLGENQLLNSMRSRIKDLFSVTVGNKNILLFTKGKLLNAQFYKDEFSGDYPRNLSGLEKHIGNKREIRRQFSVLNELYSNREASKRYQEKFKAVLPIEKPIGFFISQRDEDKGARYVIFEYVDGIITENESLFSLDRYNFQQSITAKLNEVGIFCRAAFKNKVDAVSTDNGKYVIVDSEDWEVRNRF